MQPNRRGLLATGIGGLAGCASDDSTTPERTRNTATQPAGAATQAAPVNQLTRAPQAPTEADVLVTTDGTTVTATGPDGVVAEGADAGAVLQSVVDNTPGEKPATGWRVHLTSGEFPFGQWVRTGQQGLYFTGNGYGTRLTATSDIDALFRFVQREGNHLNVGWGPRLFDFLVDGLGNASNFVSLDAVDDSHVERIFGIGLTNAVVRAQPEYADQNVDNVRIRDIRCKECAVAEFRPGEDNKVADSKIERVACNNPPEYGLILDGVQRITVERIFTGVNDNGGDGSVLVTNTNDDAETCDLYRIEMEDHTDDPEGVALRFEQAEGSDYQNRYHYVDGIRSTKAGQEKFVVVDSSANPGKTRDIRIENPQLVPNEGQIELIDSRHCEIDLNREDRLAQSVVTTSGAAVRHLINGIGRNGGDPSAGEGPWANTPMEGAVVKDTDNGGVYIAVDGTWEQMA
jgi:hypothetical protein